MKLPKFRHEWIVWVWLALVLTYAVLGMWQSALVVPYPPRPMLDVPELIDHTSTVATEIQLPGPIQWAAVTCKIHTSRVGLVSECSSPTLVLEVLYK